MPPGKLLKDMLTVGCPNCGETGKVNPDKLKVTSTADGTKIENLPPCGCGTTMQPLPEDAASLLFFGTTRRSS